MINVSVCKIESVCFQCQSCVCVCVCVSAARKKSSCVKEVEKLQEKREETITAAGAEREKSTGDRNTGILVLLNAYYNYK